MQINFAFKHMDTSAALREYTEDKVSERIMKFVTKPIAAHITFSVDKHNHHAHCAVSGGDGFHVTAEHTSDDMYASVDRMVDKLAAQLTKHKEKLKEHKGHAPMNVLAEVGDGRPVVPEDAIDASDIVRLEKKKKVGKN